MSRSPASSDSASPLNPWTAGTLDRPGERRGQLVIVVLGVLAFVPALAAFVLRVLPPRSNLGAQVASFTAYGLPFGLVASVLLITALVRARRRLVLAVITLVALGPTAAQVGWQAPLFVPDSRPVASPTLTIMSLNLKHGDADPNEILAAAAKADVVVLVETTPNAKLGLARVGWRQRFPYAAGDGPGVLSDGSIYSRYPLTDIRHLPTRFGQWAAVITTPQLGRLSVVGVHPCNPLCPQGAWQREHAIVRSVIDARIDGPLVVAGDFNAVDDHLPMRQLRRDGMRSATDLVGAGWLPTYPADLPFIPPLIPIDHVLVSPSLTATSIRTVRVDDTDHLGLVATIALTR